MPVETLNPHDPEARFLGYLGNVSETGAFVQSSNPRPVGTELSLRLHLRGAHRPPVECLGEIIWTRNYSGKRGPCPGMGIVFRRIPAESVEPLASFCAEPEVEE